jgi:endonuclease/exonuclease/phosphatase (EEP) superfamily protein YafD
MKMTARRPLVIALVLFAALASLRLSFSQQSTVAVVAAWNIKGLVPIPTARMNRIAQTIRRLNPDLILLSEVNPNQTASSIVQALGPPFQAAIILPQKPGVIQNLAIIHKSGLTVSDARLIPGTDLSEEPRSRQALTAKIRIRNFDFILIGVHLKSGRSSTERAKRTRQCDAIANFISQFTIGSEKDVLVVGDYNMIPRRGNQANDADNFHHLNPTNLLRFVSSEALSGRTSHIAGCNPTRGNLLDGLAIARGHTGEYREGSLRIPSFSALGRPCASFEANVSDHLPLVARFDTSTDDD